MHQSKLLVTFAVLAIAACTTAPKQTGTSPTALENQLVEALLAAAERESHISKVLLAPDLPPGIKSAVEGKRPAVAASSGEIAGLAKGHLLVQSATFGQSQATISARLGPVPRPRPNVALLACGTGLTVTFNLVGGPWQQGDLQTLDC